MKTIKVNASINGIRAKVDGSLGFSVSTPELSSEEKVLFMEMQGINVDLTITPLDSEAEDIVTIEKDMETKTSSRRLRDVLFVLYKQTNKKDESDGKITAITFEEFYRNHMEKLIDFIKGKLDPE